MDLPMELWETLTNLDSVFSTPKGPLDVFDRMTQLTRQVGQTTELIRWLPDDGRAIVYVVHHGHAQHFKGAILLQRPGYPVKTLRFASFKDGENDPSTRGLDWPVYVDNAAWYALCQDKLEDLNFRTRYGGDSKVEKDLVMERREVVIANAVLTGKPCYPTRKHFLAKTTCSVCDRGPCPGPEEKYWDIIGKIPQ